MSLPYSKIFDLLLALRYGLGKMIRKALFSPVRLNDRLWDFRLDIETRDQVDKHYIKSFINDAENYEGSPYSDLSMIMDRIPNKDSLQFADYGSGRGRVVCFAAQFPFEKVIGIEVDSGLVAASRKNLGSLRNRRAPAEIVQEDVVNFDCRDISVFFFYNPFGLKTMEIVLSKIRQSLVDKPRRITIVYYNPVHLSLFESCDWLKSKPSLRIKTLTTHHAKVPYVEFYENS